MTNDYDDIINLPHYEPKHHPRMSMWNRAAQFAPFAGSIIQGCLCGTVQPSLHPLPR